MLWTACQNFTKIGWLTNWKMQFYKNYANQKNWWCLAPRTRRLAPGKTKLPPSGYCCTRSMKNSIFRESTHHTPLVWRLAANGVPSGGSCICEPCLLHNNSDFIQFTTQKIVLTCLGSWSFPKTSISKIPLTFSLYFSATIKSSNSSTLR